jgi:septal ring factor EnvC (AmiA/AmiB activator)
VGHSIKALRTLAVLALFGVGAGACHAQSSVTYRCLDSQGRSTYTNVKEEMAGKRCTVVSREVSVVPASAPAPKAVVAPPIASARSRAVDRRRILEEELSDEQTRLGEARAKLAEQQAIRNGNERNYQKVLDRLKPFQESVDQHEKNIAQLKRELATLR